MEKKGIDLNLVEGAFNAWRKYLLHSLKSQNITPKHDYEDYKEQGTYGKKLTLYDIGEYNLASMRKCFLASELWFRGFYNCNEAVMAIEKGEDSLAGILIIRGIKKIRLLELESGLSRILNDNGIGGLDRIGYRNIALEVDKLHRNYSSTALENEIKIVLAKAEARKKDMEIVNKIVEMVLEIDTK